MSQTQTAAKSSFLKAPHPLLVDTLARTDVDFWQTSIKQTSKVESFETKTLEKPEEWEKRSSIRFFDSNERLPLKPIFSFANSEETGLLLQEVQLKISSSGYSSQRDSRESEYGAASTRLSIAQDMEVRFKIEALFNSYADEQFEDGMDNEFVHELTALVIRYDTKAVNCIADRIAMNRANPQVISEALRWLGQIRHPVSHRSRLSLLEGNLRSPSRWIRDGAALGLASMKDTHAVPYLREAIRKEQIPDLRDDLELVLDTLEQ